MLKIKSNKILIDTMRIPKHIAIIMDGNGRWAKKNGMNRHQGHKEGVISVHEIIKAACEIGVKYLTIYAFSIENWNRPVEEVDILMNLITTIIKHEADELIKNNIRLQIIGDISRLSQTFQNNVNDCIKKTAKNNGLILLLALSYSSRWEIIEAVRHIVNDVKNNQLNVKDINENVFSSYLATKNIPDPDLLIRTGGECRISNYLLWQIAYTELYFSNVYWPEFGKENFYEAIYNFQRRERRFGKTSDQIQNKH
ncbi:MAG: isoprenyl transferase [Bacteroidales bacterium OttesenSCG-928-I14]|jgi:undecaprenyl diphosphate synthase|nr:isoprenyl transferase [Bacteroidales bacterium OttesenSCG-928-I14]